MSLQASPSTRKWGMVALASSTHCTRCLWNWQCHIPACGMSVHLGGACLGASQCDSSGESVGMFYCIGSFYTCCNGQFIQGHFKKPFQAILVLKMWWQVSFNLRLYHLFRLIILFSLAIYRSLMPLLPYFYIFYFIFLTKEIWIAVYLMSSIVLFYCSFIYMVMGLTLLYH